MYRLPRPGALVTVAAVISLFGAPAGSGRAMIVDHSPPPKTGCAQEKQGQVGMVRAVKGRLEVRRGHGALTSAPRNTTLFRGEHLLTGTQQKASITLCNGGIVYMNKSTSVVLRARNQVQVMRGEVVARLDRLIREQLRTPAATATLEKRGRLGVKLERRKSTFIVALGTAAVQNKRGRVLVTANQEAVTAVGGIPQAPRAVDAAAAFSWTAPLARNTWHVLTAPGVLSAPRRIALDSHRNIYVTDQYHSRVVKLSPSGSLLTAWGTQGSGPGQFGQPYGIDIDSHDTVYVSDAGYARVEKFTTDGQYLTQLGSQGFDPGQFIGPTGVEVDAAGNVYVADTDLDRVQTLSPSGQSLAVYGQTPPAGGTASDAPGQFSLPGDVAVDGAGAIYVADTLNHRIQKLSATGVPLAQWGTRGSGPAQFDHPTDLVLDAQGDIYVADSGNNRIVELSADGHFVASFGTAGASHPGEFISPEGVAIDRQGNLYVVDRSNDRVQKLTRGG